ncbi:MAG TPA: hypothetical protein VES38_06860 [Methylotenera sp.]|nr:hypothetical protein [Methylotenera sp.]
MADPAEHIAEVAPVAAGFISIFITQVFDLPPMVVLMAFVGAWIGIALRDAIPEFTSRVTAVKHFFKTLFIVLSATIIAAWLMPLLLKYFPDLAQKSAAGGAGFMLVYFYPRLQEFGNFLFDVAKDFVRDIAKRIASLIKLGKGE